MSEKHPAAQAAGTQEVGGLEPAGALQDLLGLRIDGVVAYPHEDGVVDICAAGVDKSICMRLPTGEEEPTTSGGADTTVRTAVMGQTPGLHHQSVSTWVAVGNDANDVAMIRAADIGVIVGDGLEEVRARRRTIRVPSRPGAVVSILEQLLELHR
ncbi:HAD hydrolase family protein [Actinomyces sp. ZJ308]|uniref:HAD hydrolase family protein n=1 Tax=Actinomyces sp. ZJ308 TaxID=2708342 RepID=UPI001FB9C201|nr:HAD hydrolase family protein [Actinomyces sp. ZJ308]